MHFLEIDKNRGISKLTFLLSIVFVFTGVMGVGGFVQQMIINYSGMHPTLDLRDLDAFSFLKNLFFQLIPFTTGILAIFFAVYKMLGRSLKTLLGNTFNWRKRLLFAIVIFFVLFALLFLGVSKSFGALIENESFFEKWYVIFPLIVFLIVQTGFEELAFRVFLPQVFVGMGVRMISAILISSLLFGFLHMNNPEIAFYGKRIVLLYILQGFFLGILVYFDKSIVLALGYHLMNNFLSLMLLSSDNQVLKVPAIFNMDQSKIPTFMLLFQICLLIVLFFVLCYRKYQWNFKTIQKNE